MLQSYNHLFSGYHEDPATLLTTFESPPVDEMVILRNVEFWSICEHHLLPFFGKAHIAYIPSNGKIVGISKLARVLEVYTRRLQVQERICQQVVDALMEHLQPVGAACMLEAQHLCMIMRGVQKQNSVMVTSCLRGAFLDNPATRQEFLSMVKQ